MKNQKNKGNALSGSNISLMQWKTMHPVPTRIYDSDNYYQKIAQKVLLILKKHINPQVYSVENMRYIALCLTAYFEDVVSELGLFRAFVHQYRQLFSNQFPWYKIEDEYYEDEINFVDVKFVLWQSMFACRDGQVPNPENPKIHSAAEEVYDLFDQEFENAPINEQFVQDIYNEDFLEKANKLEVTLKWLGSSCYLLPVMSPIRNFYNKSFTALHGIFKVHESDQRNINILDGDYLAFAHRCGPLALYPKDWFALMRQTKGLTKGNEEILQIKATGVYPFVIVKDNEETFTLRCCRGQEYEVDKLTLASIDGHNLGVGDIVLTMLFYYKGLWNSFGFNLYNFTYSNNLEKAISSTEEAIKDFVTPTGALIDFVGNIDWSIPDNTPYGPTYDPQRCEKVISENDGNRLFYFKNIREAYDWTRNNLLNNETDQLQQKKDLPNGNSPVAVFITEDYRTILFTRVDLIHDPSNPYYNPKSEKELLGAMMRPDMIPNPLCAYMIEKNFSDRLALNSLEGEEQGLKLMQDNIRFFETIVREYQFYNSEQK